MTHPMPELSAQLKQLRLSHIADKLQLRNREAVERKLSHPEFLGLLLQDELLGRDNKKLRARIKRAHLSGDKTLESFDFDFNPKINRAQIQELASCSFIAEKVPVLIVGPCGTGKSHIAQAIAHCAIRRGIDTLCLSQTKIFSELQAARAAGRFDKKFSELVKIPLLVVDDFGLRPLRNPQDEDFHDLISERYERASTIITSNLDFTEWGSAFPNRLLAAATIDRLRHNAYRLTIDGPSFRGDRKTEINDV
ncbi:TPA: IS21-like element helper ATPase IstB [Legionella pneumophila]|nr:IS21-like element helper ATPase IstB [Legionella pneumophila]HDV5807161.1 IS21-like element helper ATPase IstB [Legionella pneumophila]